MTDLKRISAESKEDVTYLWVSSQRRGAKKKRVSPAPRPGRSVDPMSIPWGDIVETPLRILRRMFHKD
jgi:hypothetical protein